MVFPIYCGYRKASLVHIFSYRGVLKYKSNNMYRIKQSHVHFILYSYMIFQKNMIEGIFHKNRRIKLLNITNK